MANIDSLVENCRRHRTSGEDRRHRTSGEDRRHRTSGEDRRYRTLGDFLKDALILALLANKAKRFVKTKRKAMLLFPKRNRSVS